MDPQAPELPKLPVVEERVEVHKATETVGAVRVRLEAHEALHTVAVDTRRDEVEVRRVPCNTPVTERQGPRQEGEVLIVPVYEEEVTLQRRWVLKEELHLHRHSRQQVERLQVPVLREQVVVERLQPDGRWHAEPPH